MRLFPWVLGLIRAFGSARALGRLLLHLAGPLTWDADNAVFAVGSPYVPFPRLRMHQRLRVLPHGLTYTGAVHLPAQLMPHRGSADPTRPRLRLPAALTFSTTLHTPLLRA